MRVFTPRFWDIFVQSQYRYLPEGVEGSTGQISAWLPRILSLGRYLLGARLLVPGHIFGDLFIYIFDVICVGKSSYFWEEVVD